MREETPNTRGLARRYLMALIAAALVAPVLVLGAGAPVWLGALCAGLVFVLLALFAARAAPDGPQASAPRGRKTLLAAVMGEARPALARIEAVIDALPRNAVRDRLDAIAEIAARVIRDVEAAPARLTSVQRLLTYYLPRTAEIAEGYQELRRRETGRPERYAAIEQVLAHTEAAFVQFSEAMIAEDMRSLDAEIRLVEGALKEDLGDSRAAPKTS